MSKLPMHSTKAPQLWAIYCISLTQQRKLKSEHHLSLKTELQQLTNLRNSSREIRTTTLNGVQPLILSDFRRK